MASRTALASPVLAASTTEADGPAAFTPMMAMNGRINNPARYFERILDLRRLLKYLRLPAEIQPSGAVAQRLDGHAHPIEHREEEVRHRRIHRRRNVLPAVVP